MLTESLALFAQVGAGGMPEGIENQVGFMVGQCIGGVIGAAIGSLLGALFLQLAVKWVCRIELPYWFAYARVFTLSIINVFISFVLQFLGLMSGSPQVLIVMNLLGALLSIVVMGVYYGMAIKDYQGMPIGIGKGFLVTLVLLAIGFAIAFVLIAIIAAIIFGVTMIGP